MLWQSVNAPGTRGSRPGVGIACSSSHNPGTQVDLGWPTRGAPPWHGPCGDRADPRHWPVGRGTASAITRDGERGPQACRPMPASVLRGRAALGARRGRDMSGRSTRRHRDGASEHKPGNEGESGCAEPFLRLGPPPSPARPKAKAKTSPGVKTSVMQTPTKRRRPRGGSGAERLQAGGQAEEGGPAAGVGMGQD